MNAVLRKVSVGARLAAAFGALTLLLLAVIGVSMTTTAEQTRAAHAESRAATLEADALRLQYNVADLNGWQTSYAFDVALGLPGAASDDGASRRKFLAAAESARERLSALEEAGLDSADAATLASARKGFDAYVALDDKVIAGYRSGTPAERKASDALVGGEAMTLFAALVQDTEALASSFRAAAKAAGTASEAAAAKASRAVTLLGGCAVVLAILLSVLIARSITVPLGELRARLQDIAEGDGDLTARLPEGGADEVGAVSHAFNRFADKVARLVATVAQNAVGLGGAAEEMSAVSQQLRAGSEVVSGQAEEMAAATQQMSGSIVTIAAGSEEMVASTGDIAKSSFTAAEVVGNAVAVAGSANQAVAELGAASVEIGSVIKVITSIAEQTNLLALNATIEAARAGEAGKGFAVVANEVKELAQETARATEDIGRKLEAIQSGSAAATEAIERIGGIISQVHDTQTTIAAAVEEQTATTADMGQSVGQIAEASRDVAAQVSSLASVAAEGTLSAGHAEQSAHELARLATQLRDLVSGYRY